MGKMEVSVTTRHGGIYLVVTEKVCHGEVGVHCQEDSSSQRQSFDVGTSFGSKDCEKHNNIWLVYPLQLLVHKTVSVRTNRSAMVVRANACPTPSVQLAKPVSWESVSSVPPPMTAPWGPSAPVVSVYFEVRIPTGFVPLRSKFLHVHGLLDAEDTGAERRKVTPSRETGDQGQKAWNASRFHIEVESPMFPACLAILTA